MANITAPIMLDSTGQDIADAISTIGATSVGNLNALTTTDKSSLVGAVNEVKSGLTVDVLLEPTLATGTSTVHQLAGDIGNYKLLLVTLGADVSRTQASNVIVMANTRQYYNVSYQTIDTRLSFDTTTSISIEGQWYVAVYGVLK